ncbi:hypothetical protein AB1Y20_014306 [Prymnesium parvum]|uniref:Lipase maturation factor 2 n=1 Tax=Prymnesium parvum TaxID=97485 RepID=A0AB34IHA1_PRYPA
MAEVSCRRLFLRCVGGLYVAAFTSFWLQLPGLVGDDGLLPARASWPPPRPFSSHPSLLSFAPSADAVELLLEALALGGVLGGMAALAGLHHAALFAALFLSYLSLFASCQPWLSFQWDLFLLETGAATVLYAPWRALATREEAGGAAHPFAWVLRAQWVKFMLCSGVAKVSANCPTWKHLTALEFHFASTCLPTAEAWYLHSLPPPLLRAGVAYMFVCELVAPWLLLLPITAARRVGVVVQLPLQIAIMYSGNYNWFNLHTAALLLPAWERDVRLAPRRAPPHPLAAPLAAWERAWASAAAASLAAAAAWASLAAAAWHLFTLELRAADGFLAALRTPDALVLRSRVDAPLVAAILAAARSPRAVAYLYSLTAIAAVGYALDAGAAAPFPSSRLPATASPPPPLLPSPSFFATAPSPPSSFHTHTHTPPPHSPSLPHSSPGVSVPAEPAPPPRLLRRASRGALFLSRLALAAASLVYLGVTLLPLDTLPPRPATPLATLIPPHLGLRAATTAAAAALRPFHASNAYGLFRRMTGVGAVPAAANSSAWGWGGLPPSVVAVPAVVIEGEDADGAWVEVPLRYAPSREARPPRRTAPHQPRLDWQMWFAALGSYHAHPWLLHLLYKLLLPNATASAALRLLDADAFPFAAAPPRRVRASLYHYDFTRLPSPWAARLPHAAAVRGECVAAWRAATGWGGGGAPCDHWWVRRRVGEYVPPLTRQALLEAVVRRHGWPEAPPPPRRADGACAAGAAAWACRAVVEVVRRGEPLRRYVGVELRLPRLGPSPWFVDGPLLIIVAAVLLPLAVGGAWSKLCRRRYRTGV